MINTNCIVPKKHEDKTWPKFMVAVPSVGDEVQEVGKRGDKLKSLVVKKVRFGFETGGTAPHVDVVLDDAE